MLKTTSDSMRVHGLRPKQGFALRVTLTNSENPHIKYPAEGYIVAFEQGTSLGISQAVFHLLYNDGRLGAPVVVPDPEFTYPAVKP